MFTITQNNRDEQLLRSLVNYLGVGRHVTRNGDNGEFLVTDIISSTRFFLEYSFNTYV